jgi:hypothetical protein
MMLCCALFYFTKACRLLECSTVSVPCPPSLGLWQTCPHVTHSRRPKVGCALPPPPPTHTHTPVNSSLPESWVAESPLPPPLCSI